MVLTYKVIDRIFNPTDSVTSEKKDSTIIVPAFPDAKIADAVFICNPDTAFIEYECSVKSVADNQIELLVLNAVDEHPWLSVDSLVDNDILSRQFADKGLEQLSQTAMVQLKTIFASPERYK